MDEGCIVRTRPLPRVGHRRNSPISGECFDTSESRSSASLPNGPRKCWRRRVAHAIARALLPRGWQLKDATPANVLFGTRTVFVDLPSIIPREPGGCL
jgi:hypothetical protein